MTFLTDHGSRFTDNRFFFHSAPAVILAVSLFLGSCVGRFTHEHDRSWLSITMPALSILAFVQPTRLTLSAAGLISGIVLENLKLFHVTKIPEIEGKNLTIKGKVAKVMPSLYGQNILDVRVSELWSLEREPLKFPLQVSIPAINGIVPGSEMVLRVVMTGTYPLKRSFGIRSRTLPGALLALPKTHSLVVKGRRRLLKTLHDFREKPACGLLSAISLGERWRVNSWTRDALRKTGTYHLLAISGVHIGAAVWPFLFLMRLCSSVTHRARPRIINALLLVLSVLAVSIYISFTGISSSALRAAVFIVLAGSAMIWGRRSRSLASLSWCVILILCFGSGSQPDVSLVLSALAVTGIILSGRGESVFFTRSVRMTMGALFFTLPVAVWIAGGISVSALAGNIVGGLPFGLLLIPIAVMLDLVALFPSVPLAPLIALWIKAANLVMGCLEWIANWPYSFLRLSYMGSMFATLTAIAAIFTWWRRKYRLGEGLAIYLIVLAVAWSGHFVGEKFNQKDLVISFPSVGQADAAIIRYRGQTVLIDCGPPGIPGRDSPVARALQRMGVRHIDAIFLSHIHPDHSGGLEDIMVRWPVESLLVPEGYGGRRDLKGISIITSSNTRLRLLRYGDVVKFPLFDLTVLGPEYNEEPLTDLNRGSLQLLLETGGFKALFTGDAGWDQVHRSMSQIKGLHLLKIPHHGSKNGFPPVGLDDVVYRATGNSDLIAVCPSKPPGHRHLPVPEVIRWFERRGVRLVYTGDKGVKVWYKKGTSMENKSTVVDNPYWF